MNGWDVRKFIQHLVKSNAVMLEWLQSSIQYRKDEAVLQALWQLSKAFFCPVKTSWYYLSMARNKLAEISDGDTAKIKRYFYVLRPLACIRFIREHGEIPFMEYRRNLAEIHMQEDILMEIEALMAQKDQTKEAQEIKRNDVLLSFFAREIAIAKDWLSKRTKRPDGQKELANECFRTILEIVHETT